MKSRIFTTFLCCLSFCFAFSQNYSSLLDGVDLQYCNNEFTNIYQTNFSLSITDTIDWDSIGYVKKAYFSPYSPNDSSRYLLENDFGQVWFFDENNLSAPGLIYDFSLNVGDTTSILSGDHHLQFDVYYSTVVITETDTYTSPSGSIHKRLYINHIDGYVVYGDNVWIEGIGAITGGLLYSLTPSDPHITLNEVRRTGELIYDSEIECVVAVESIEQADISLWHQNNTIHIKRPNEQAAIFFVYDMNGKLVHTQEVRQNTSIGIDLPRGVYVGFFRENSGEEYSGKFVVAD